MKRRRLSRQSSKILDIQTANDIVTSDTQAHQRAWDLSMETFGGRFTISATIGETLQWAWEILFCGRQEKLPDYHKDKNVIECSIENFVPVVTVTQIESCTIHWILVRKLWARKRSGGYHVGSAYAIHGGLKEYDASSTTPNAGGDPKHVVEEQSLDDRTPLGCQRCKERYFDERHREWEKNHRGPNQEEMTMCWLIIRKILIVKSVKRQKQHEPIVE